MSEKSGIQMIEEIIEKVNLLDRRFTIVEQMMKELLNRTNGLAQPMCSTESETVGPVPSIAASSPLPELQIKPTIRSGNKEPPKELKIGDAPKGDVEIKSSKVMGKIKNSDGRVVSGVNVKIFDGNNKIVKTTKTNRAGDWMCFLPPGKYGAEYFLKNMINSNVVFNVTPGQTLLRVAQPNI